jgi:methanogenic corrinoid protein MtbC1
MAYIRLKRIKGKEYAYLVESVWDRESKQPRQVTIKYLGRVDSISLESIPMEYRNDPKIISFISDYRISSKGNRVNEDIMDTISIDKRGLVELLASGDSKQILDIFDRFYNDGSVDSILRFYEELIIPALDIVGELWMKNKLGIAIEHVCSNTVNTVIKSITSLCSNDKSKGLIVIATPHGDLHSIASNMLESLLTCKGYRVLNIAPSTPRDVIIDYVRYKDPDALLLSVTMEDNVERVDRLVRILRSSYSKEMPIIVGGKASHMLRCGECRVVKESSLKSILTVIDEEVSRYVRIKQGMTI